MQTLHRLLKRRAEWHDLEALPTSAAGDDPLLRLAGTWSQEKANTFVAAISPLEHVDAELWS